MSVDPIKFSAPLTITIDAKLAHRGAERLIRRKNRNRLVGWAAGLVSALAGGWLDRKAQAAVNSEVSQQLALRLPQDIADGMMQQVLAELAKELRDSGFTGGLAVTVCCGSGEASAHRDITPNGESATVPAEQPA